ncbi:glycerol-3-phosphate responsive antiterminator [Alkalibacillus sp. S2W]|uniref:glycerol-3-phosphate responsive antiterminator n=1 Tax=Alkalibacillus sp. S2W TaxID=3386553 RepID=UPI00398CF030
MLSKQSVLPAVKKPKDIDRLIDSDTEVIILLETRLSSLQQVVKKVKQAGKRVIIHVDMIQGLKTDQYGMEFIGHNVKPDGIISTRTNIIQLAKKYQLITIQRVFLIDSQAIEHNLELIKQTKPDYVELLPGVMPHVIAYVHEALQTDAVGIVAGGLIREQQDVDLARQAGVSAVSTSLRELWDFDV